MQKHLFTDIGIPNQTRLYCIFYLYHREWLTTIIIISIKSLQRNSIAIELIRVFVCDWAAYAVVLHNVPLGIIAITYCITWIICEYEANAKPSWELDNISHSRSHRFIDWCVECCIHCVECCSSSPVDSMSLATILTSVVKIRMVNFSHLSLSPSLLSHWDLTDHLPR